MALKSPRVSPPYAMTTREARTFGRLCRAAHARFGSVSDETVLLIGDWVRIGSRLTRLAVLEDMAARKGADGGAVRLMTLARDISEATRLRLELADRLGLTPATAR